MSVAAHFHPLGCASMQGFLRLQQLFLRLCSLLAFGGTVWPHAHLWARQLGPSLAPRRWMTDTC